MNLKFNNKVPAAERRGIIVLAILISILSLTVATCESGFFYNPITVSESISDNNASDKALKLHSKKEKKKSNKTHKSKRKQTPAPQPRNPLDEPITIN